MITIVTRRDRRRLRHLLREAREEAVVATDLGLATEAEAVRRLADELEDMLRQLLEQQAKV